MSNRYPVFSKEEIVDIPGRMLGQATSSTIRIDRDDASAGWFIDPTPEDDLEFVVSETDISLVAVENSPAAGRYDLLTVIAHELSHALGEDHGEDGGLMDAELPTGTRRALSLTAADPLAGTATSDLDAAFAAFHKWDETYSASS